jgi:hypothetical protein
MNKSHRRCCWPGCNCSIAPERRQVGPNVKRDFCDEHRHFPHVRRPHAFAQIVALAANDNSRTKLAFVA